jgi:tRNA threonylcarbamoyladenosine biosynthesis protein TsaB
MARILAIDTTGEFGSIALFEDGVLTEQIPMHSPEGFGHILFEHINRLLSRHSITANDIVCFAAASGPGSFTGVRIGLAAAKGLAEATAKPMVAVSNLKALAWYGRRPHRASLLDARRGEIYGAVYDATLEIVCPETVMKYSAWHQTLPEGDIEIISPDAALFPGSTAAPRALAEAVAAIADTEYEKGRAQDPAAIDANYVRRSDAELLWKDG